MFSRFFIERPVLSNVIAMVMMLLGGIAIVSLPVAQFPAITPPTVVVTAFYPGASARTVKTMTSQAPRRLAQLEVWITLPASLTEQQRAELQRAGESCPVKLSLEGCVVMVLHWD